MVYYTIDLTPESRDFTTIVTKFGKFRYNRVPMGLCASSEIFQAKAEYLLGDIEGVRRIPMIYWNLVKVFSPEYRPYKGYL